MSASEFKLTEWTLTLLKNFASINPSVLLEEGNVLRTITPAGTIYAIGKLDQMLPKTCAIYNVGKFLATLSLFEQPIIEFNDDHMIIRDGNRLARYSYTDAKFIVSPPAKQDLPVGNADYTFDIGPDTLRQLNKALGVFDQPHVSIECTLVKNTVNAPILITTTNADSPSKDGFLTTIGTGSSTFKYVFNKEKFLVLPMAYKVTLHNKKKLIKLVSGNMITYYIAAEGKYTVV